MEKTFSRKYHLNIHIRNVHEGEGNGCLECGESSAQKNELKRHMLSLHSADCQKSADCQNCLECGKQFSNEVTLETHICSVHVDELQL